MQPGFPKEPGPLKAESGAHFVQGYLYERCKRDGLPKGGYPNMGGIPKTTVASLEQTTSFIEAFDAEKKK